MTWRARTFGHYAWPCALFVFVALAIWEFASRNELVNEIILPPPTEVADAFVELLQTDYVWTHFFATLSNTVLGFLLGGGLAFVLASLMVMNSLIRRALYPIAILVQTLPRVALAPLFITWFGFGSGPKIVMAATICFFSVLINTIVGMTSVSEDELSLMKSLRASKLQVFFQLRLPAAAPAIMAGVKTAITFALVGSVVVELVGAKEGLGVLIERFNFSLEIPFAFATILLLALMGLGLYAIAELAERKLVFWVDREQAVPAVEGER
jgi:NitT/TauT family transport system permease protein